MELQIDRITGHTPPESERLILKVIKETNLGDYMLMDTLREGQELSLVRNRHIFLFPNISVKPGNSVVVYTGKGEDTVITTDQQEIRYSFYWNLSKRLWRKHIGNVYLVKIDSWVSKKL